MAYLVAAAWIAITGEEARRQTVLRSQLGAPIKRLSVIGSRAFLVRRSNNEPLRDWLGRRWLRLPGQKALRAAEAQKAAPRSRSNGTGR